MMSPLAWFLILSTPNKPVVPKLPVTDTVKNPAKAD